MVAFLTTADQLNTYRWEGLLKCPLRWSLIPTTYKDVYYLEVMLIGAVLGCNIHLLPYLITIY